MSCDINDHALQDDAPLGMMCGCGHSNKNHHHPSRVCIVCMEERITALESQLRESEARLEDEMYHDVDDTP